MSLRTHGCAALVLLICSLVNAQPASAPTDRTRKLLDQVRVADERQRQEAVIALSYSQPKELPAIEATLRLADLDPEVRRRLTYLAGLLKYRAAKLAATDRKAEWLRKLMLAGYDQGPGRKPAWDEMAHALIPSEAVLWFGVDTATEPVRAAAERCRKLMQAGCTDALIQYCDMQHRELGVPNPPADAVDVYYKLAQTVQKTSYPAPVKLFIMLRGAHRKLNRSSRPPSGRELGALIDEALALLQEALKDKDLAPDVLYGWCDELVQRQMEIGRTREEAYNHILPMLLKALPQSSVPYALRGRFYIDWAWDARGAGYADTVPQEGWQQFRERLGEAEEALKKAWQLDPMDSRAPTAMITVCMGQGKARADMETWFARATQADPDNVEACRAKLLYLQPKWHGSVTEMLQFGRQCMDEGNWYSQIPATIFLAHATIAQDELDAGQIGSIQQHYSTVPCWADVSRCFQAYLIADPDNYRNRAQYARAAVWAGQWTIADAQFRILGPNPHEDVRGILGGWSGYDELRAEAARKAKRPTNP